MATWLTTRECADVLGVSATFVREEIQDGRLDAQILDRPVLEGRTRSKRIYRVEMAVFRDYCQRWCPRVVSKLPPAA